MNDFFIYTNPLAWVYFIILLVKFFVEGFLSAVGIIDWYFAIFKLNSMKKEYREQLLEVYEVKEFKFFWLKEKAWEYTVKKLKNEQ